MSEAYTDALPADLDAVNAGYVGPYQFPDNARRRWPAALYLLSGLALVGTWALEDGSSYVNAGLGVGGLVLIVLGVHHLLAARATKVNQTDALTIAAQALGFPVGHAASQMAWRGWLSRPTWRLLVYSAEEPPCTRGLVLIDANDGTVLHRFTEDNPEDWTDFDEGRTALRRPGE